MDYYQKKFYLAQINRDDQLISPIERWRAHQEGILHRGFTVVLVYQRQFILQHRKHPAFDGFFDLSFSSHPIYVKNQLQSMEEAIYDTLKREWNLSKKDLKTDLKYIDKFHYKARDPYSVYTEHEVDYLYSVEITRLPQPILEFSYGYDLLKISSRFNRDQISSFQLAPWIKKINLSKLL